MADNEDTADNKAPSPNLYFIKEAREASVPQPLTGSHDLMSIFKLQPLYDQYVKQKLPNNEDVPPIEPTYFPFIKHLPGKNVIRPGNYIRQLLEAPEKNYQPIHQFTSSTLRDAFSLRVGPVPGFDASVLGTDEGAGYKQAMKNLAAVAPAAGLTASAGAAGASNSLRPSSAAHGYGVPGYGDPSSVPMSSDLPVHSSHGHSSHHGHSTHHGSKSSTSSPYVDKAERGEDGGREHKHKKKKKKRKHEHDHEHGHHEGEGDSEHRKKKKRKREREEHEHGDHGEHGELVIV